jgi:enoyl-CoA hydratase/carnithine racemase
MKEYDLLKLEHFDDGVVLISLNNPPLNLMTPALMQQLCDALQELANDNAMRAVVLTGSQRAFCAGADVNSFGVFPKGTNTALGQFYYRKIEDCRLPIIAAIEGHCLGGGLELALCCDIRYASETAKIGLTEANLGLYAAYGGMTRLPWLIGEANAKRMFYTAARLPGAEAVRYGVCQEVYPGEELIAKALELAHLIATKAPGSIAEGKAVFHQFRSAAFSDGFRQEQLHSPSTSYPQDFREGIAALKEKRTPKFNYK